MTDHPSAEALRRELEAAIAQLAQARCQLGGEGAVDIDGILLATDHVAASLSSLDDDTRQSLLPHLTAVLDEVSALSDRLRAEHGSMKHRLRSAGVQRRVAAAYKRR